MALAHHRPTVQATPQANSANRTATGYAVLFVDKCADPISRRQLRAKLRARFQLSDPALEQLFNPFHHPVVTKKGCDWQTAQALQHTLKALGAVSWIQPLEADGQYRERRRGERRRLGDRRSIRRTSSIVPDRRVTRGRRSSDR